MDAAGKPAAVRDENGNDRSISASSKSYVAFAFAAADLLIEATAEGRIVFAIGAAMSLVGRPARLLNNMDLPELFRPSQEPRIRTIVQRMAAGERVRHVLLQVVLPDGGEMPVAMSGYPHPDNPDHIMLVLMHSGTLLPTVQRKKHDGLLDREGLEALAETVIKENPNGTGESLQLTLLDIPQITELRKRLGSERSVEFVEKFSDCLNDISIGDAAAKLSDNKFGIIHGAEITSADIEQRITELASSLSVGAELLSAQATHVSLDAAGISAEEATNALVYTINRFSADGGTITDLAKAAKPGLSETVAKMREVKAVINRGEFELNYQPIVDLWNNAVHHFECLVRFKGGESPYTMVTFAEDVGMVGELDMAILDRAMGFMRAGPGIENGLKFAVNLSGRSLGNAATAAKLLKTLHSAVDLRGRLMFEVTESAEIKDLQVANAVIQEIRSRGFLVGLDDFGAGSAAFHYLRSLQVDHVKIDGSYVTEAVATGASLPFLRAISQLCRELKVATIAEHIENQETANLLRLYNVRYGQGYYFGKPMKPSSERGWTTPVMSWRNDVLYFSVK